MEIGLPSTLATTAPPQAQNLAFDQSNLLVELRYGGGNLPFILDTGLNRTYLFKRFGQRFPQALLGSVASTSRQSGLGYDSAASYQIVPQLDLAVGNNPVSLREIAAYTVDEPTILPPVFGQVGGDLLANGYELDFQQLRFSLAATDPPLSAVPSPVATPTPGVPGSGSSPPQ